MLTAIALLVLGPGPELPRPNFETHFKGLKASFILRHGSTGRTVLFGKEQLDDRLSPCSTFKIVNSLIALELNVVKDAETKLQWDGVVRSRDALNEDHSLRTAMSNSVVWYYQRLALKIGAKRMQAHLDKIPYGNRDISGGQTEFWLGSTLKISAMEQLSIVERLAASKLPFSQRSHKIVREIMLIDKGPGWSLYGKTGSGMQNGRTTYGWFVGWVQSGDKRYCFASNIRAADDAHGLRNRDICRALLREMKLISK